MKKKFAGWKKSFWTSKPMLVIFCSANAGGKVRASQIPKCKNHKIKIMDKKLRVGQKKRIMALKIGS
jgi:hypothetical protein